MASPKTAAVLPGGGGGGGWVGGQCEAWGPGKSVFVADKGLGGGSSCHGNGLAAAEFFFNAEKFWQNIRADFIFPNYFWHK